MKPTELQFPIEDDFQKSAVQAAKEERQEQAEQEHVEAEAAAMGDMPRVRVPHLHTLGKPTRA